MKNNTIFLLAFLFLPAMIFADSDFFAKKMGFYATSGFDYSLFNFTYNNTSATAIVFHGEPYLFVVPSENEGGGDVLLADNVIESALSAYYFSSGFSPNLEETFSDVHSGIAEIRGVHREGEDKCRILTGTDRHECVDFTSCQQACYSVTSFCFPLALGNGRYFINTIWRFENDSRDLESAYNSEGSAYAEFAREPDNANALSYLSSLSEINKAAAKASESLLYTGYSFCFSAEYSLARLTELQTAAQRGYSKASPFLLLDDGANKVKKRAMVALSGMEKDKMEEDARKRVALSSRTEGDLPGNGAAAMHNNESGNGGGAFSNDLLMAGASLALMIGFVILAAFLVLKIRPKAGKK